MKIKHILQIIPIISFVFFISNLHATENPTFVLPDVTDKLQSSKQWQGKLQVLNFWATWCTPCKDEIPLFNQLQQKYKSDDVIFIGIAIDNKKAVEIFNNSIPIEYPNLIGGDNGIKLVMQYGNTQGVLPYTVIIDRDNKIAAIAKGRLTESKLTRLIEKNL